MSTAPLEIRAGKRALERIRDRGLNPDDVRSVFGASGAAKWLAIAGLDAAIFGRWLSQSSQPVDCFGTSIGAIKLAAAVQAEPERRIQRLAEAYIRQSYVGRPTPVAIAAECDRVLDAALGDAGVTGILAHERYRYHCGAVTSNSGLATNSQYRQSLSMLRMAGRALGGRKFLQSDLERVVFYQQGNNKGDLTCVGADGFRTHRVPLDSSNLRAAILASGSIPVYMDLVEAELKTDHGSIRLPLRDGGLLDYHPIPQNIQAVEGGRERGLVLYPHFYPRLRETWFDKFFVWRKVAANMLDDVVLVYPSQQFVADLPQKRIPDRGDFQRFANDDEQRQRLWREAVDRSAVLGDYWMQLVERNDWSMVKAF